MTEQTREATGNDVRVGLYWPDHFAPMTWARCIADGCRERLDPWEHKTRCPRHQADEDARRERVRAIVTANRDAERRRVNAS